MSKRLVPALRLSSAQALEHFYRGFSDLQRTKPLLSFFLWILELL